MGRGSDLSPNKISEIRTLLLHTSHSQRKIAKLLGVSASVVNKIKTNLDKNLPLSPKRKGRCGRKRITTARDDRKIKHIYMDNPSNASHLTNLIKESGIEISQRTVRRRLAEKGLKGQHPSKKPKLTEVVKKKRLALARNKVRLSDVSTSEIFADKSTCAHVPHRKSAGDNKARNRKGIGDHHKAAHRKTQRSMAPSAKNKISR